VITSGPALLEIFTDILDTSRIESGTVDLEHATLDHEATIERETLIQTEQGHALVGVRFRRRDGRRLLSRLEALDRMDIAERRRSHDRFFDPQVNGRSGRLRPAITATNFGESVFICILGSHAKPRTLHGLALGQAQQQMLERASITFHQLLHSAARPPPDILFIGEIRPAGRDVTEGADDVQVHKRISAEHHDLVLSDLQMPNPEGMYLLELLHAKVVAALAILHSGSADPRVAALVVGFRRGPIQQGHLHTTEAAALTGWPIPFLFLCEAGWRPGCTVAGDLLRRRVVRTLADMSSGKELERRLRQPGYASSGAAETQA
jgi:CheY-like chemotaxis protein